MSQDKKIKAALAKMKVGQIKTVIVGPGRQGRILVKKGKPGTGPTLLKGLGSGKRRARVIRRKR